MVGISANADELMKPATVKRRRNVTFDEEEHIINPEDIDSNVGRFRNLVQSTIIPNKKPRLQSPAPNALDDAHSLSSLIFNRSRSLSATFPSGSKFEQNNPLTNPSSLLGIRLPNPAPEIEEKNDEAMDNQEDEEGKESNKRTSFGLYDFKDLDPNENKGGDEHEHKKYAKEAWPGPHKLFS